MDHKLLTLTKRNLRASALLALYRVKENRPASAGGFFVP
ncbi:hypothetical protein B4134_0991 [Bacillus safensis]|nr:hypothetical protein B4107_0824 [Bacillus safensis]KIL22084.1 hypothetical protein B4134_0991 [Bacillus safensis]